MDKEYLLTYLNKDKACHTYEWFDTEGELFDFVEENNIEIIDAIKINNCEALK